MNRRRFGKLILSVGTILLTLSACAVYEPAPTAYAYPGYYQGYYAAPPAYVYGPPVYGSVYVGNGWGWGGRHWR